MKLKKQQKMQESEFLDFWFTLLSFHLVTLSENLLYFYVYAHVEGGVQGKRTDLEETSMVSMPWKYFAKKYTLPSISSRTQLLITIIEDVSDERRFYTTKSKSFWGKVNIFWNNTALRTAVLSKHLYCQLLCSLKHPLKVKTFAQNWLI